MRQWRSKGYPQPQSAHCLLGAHRIACFGKETHTHRGRNSFVPRADTRNLNRRGSTLWRPLVSVDLRTDEISSTGGHRFFAPFFTENEHTGSFSGRFEPRAPRATGLQVTFTFGKCHTVAPLPSLPSTTLGMTHKVAMPQPSLKRKLPNG